MMMRRQNALLGLSLEANEVRVCRVVRQGTDLKVTVSLALPIPLARFKSDPVAAGTELRKLLKAAALRSRECVVCLPLTWAFAAEVELPKLSDADLAGFFELEAERRFPLPPDELLLSTVTSSSESGVVQAMLLGLPADYVNNVLTALKTAGLKPVSLTFGVAALADEHAGKACLVLNIGPDSVDLAVRSEAGLHALRNLCGSDSADLSHQQIDLREISRQLRITLAQLTPTQQALLTSAVLYGGDDASRDLRLALAESLANQGMTVSAGSLAGAPSSSDASLPLLAAAARILRGAPLTVNVLPKRKARAKSWRLSGRNLRLTIGGAVAAVLLVGGAYWSQTRRLSELEQTWDAMSPRVESVRALQDRVRQYRPWYDQTVPSLAIPKNLAAAFPDDGAVWVKTLKVKDGSVATCSGSARNNADWMQVLDKLGKNQELDALQVVQTQGGAPLGFTLTFRWKKGDMRGS